MPSSPRPRPAWWVRAAQRSRDPPTTGPRSRHVESAAWLLLTRCGAEPAFARDEDRAAGKRKARHVRRPLVAEVLALEHEAERPERRGDRDPSADERAARDAIAGVAI